MVGNGCPMPPGILRADAQARQRGNGLRMGCVLDASARGLVREVV